MVGRIGRPHGVRGSVTVEVRTDDPDDRFAPGRVLSTEPVEFGPLRVAASQVHSGRWILQFDGIDDRGAAEGLRDALMLLPVDALPPLGDADEFYDHQLVGLQARLAGGQGLGRVTDVLHAPAGDLLVVDAEDREVLVPFRREVVPTVDVAAGFLLVVPTEGLLEL